MQRSSHTLLRWAYAAQGSLGLRAYGAAAPLSSRTGGDVPPGHLNSDLKPSVCNIGLGRRRDLTLRQDLCLYNLAGTKTSLSEVLKGKKVIIVGFPGGSICTEKHIPSFVNMAEELSSHGVDKIVAVTVNTPEAAKEVATKVLPQGSMVDILADRNGGLMRLLGVEIGDPDAVNEPRCQRFAAIVEDGILLKLRVEQSPKELEVSDAQSMLNLWKCVYPSV